MGLKQTEDGIQRNLLGMINRANTVSSYLNRNLFNQFKQAQINRWQTQNDSEGMPWKQVDPESPYGKLKKKRFASYRGAGSVTMIATGTLADAAQGRNSANYYKLVTNTSFTFGVNTSSVTYANYPGVLRPYMKFSERTTNQFKKGIRDFIARNKGGL